MNHGSLFSGIGGFDLAAQRMGWKNVFYCEWNSFGQKILKEHWPKAVTYNDITKTDFTIHRGSVDVLSGGFPCQPYSAAGKRLGKEDERHLWPEMLRAIREIEPTWVVGENVLGLVNWNGGMVFEEVQADLEAHGYEVQPFVLPAAGVSAPHRRHRVWFVAYSNSNGLKRCNGEYEINPSERGVDALSVAFGSSDNRSAADSGFIKLQGGIIDGGIKESGQTENEGGQSGRSVFTEWEEFPTQPPVCDGNDGFSTELLRQRIREDSIGNLSEKEINKILSKAYNQWRTEAIKAGGNAIVHQVALQIFKAIDLYTDTHSQQL